MTTIANKLLVCVCCIMVFLLSITSTAAVHLQMVTANYIKMGGCPPDLLPPSDCPRVDQSSCPHHELVKDKCHACKICPKKLDEACGGPYYVYGVCSTDGAIPPRKLYCTKNGQEISQQALMNGVSKTGVCKPRACSRDCSRKKMHLVCGSDGEWRYNKCFLTQESLCNETSASVTIDIASDATCGDKPTVEEILNDSKMRVRTKTRTITPTSSSRNSTITSSVVTQTPKVEVPQESLSLTSSPTYRGEEKTR